MIGFINIFPRFANKKKGINDRGETHFLSKNKKIKFKKKIKFFFILSVMDISGIIIVKKK